MCEDFIAAYSARVDGIIKSCSQWITHECVTEPLYHNSFVTLCVAKATYYRIHPHIQELLAVNSVTKRQAMIINFGLTTLSIADCYAPIYYNGSILNAYSYDFRVMDWIQFANTMNSQFYVNCNIESDEYGKILHGYMENEYRITTIGTVENFVQLIHQWINTNHSTAKFINMEEINTFLDSECREQNIYCETPTPIQTYRYILENKDAVVGMSIHDNICRSEIIDLTQDERDKYILEEAQRISITRQYNDTLISIINSRLRLLMCYGRNRSRSFGNWLLSR